MAKYAVVLDEGLVVGVSDVFVVDVAAKDVAELERMGEMGDGGASARIRKRFGGQSLTDLLKRSSGGGTTKTART